MGRRTDEWTDSGRAVGWVSGRAGGRGGLRAGRPADGRAGGRAGGPGYQTNLVARPRPTNTITEPPRIAMVLRSTQRHWRRFGRTHVWRPPAFRIRPTSYRLTFAIRSGGLGDSEACPRSGHRPEVCLNIGAQGSDLGHISKLLLRVRRWWRVRRCWPMWPNFATPPCELQCELQIWALSELVAP